MRTQPNMIGWGEYSQKAVRLERENTKLEKEIVKIQKDLAELRRDLMVPKIEDRKPVMG